MPLHEKRRPLTKREAADYLGIKLRQIDSLWGKRQIAAIRVGRLIRFDPDDLDAYLDAHRVPVMDRRAIRAAS